MKRTIVAMYLVSAALVGCGALPEKINDVYASAVSARGEYCSDKNRGLRAIAYATVRRALGEYPEGGICTDLTLEQILIKGGLQ